MKKILTLLLAFMAMTFCIKAQNLLSESFDSGTLPMGWTAIDSDADGYNWSLSPFEGAIYANTGSGYIASASYINNIGALNPNNWLITPQISIPAEGAILSFYTGAFGYPEPLEVLVSTTGNTVADFTSTAIYNQSITNNITEGGYVLATVNLSNYAGQSIYIAFVHRNSYDNYWLFLDDITINAVPSTPTISVTPSTLVFNNTLVGDTSVATLNVDAYNLTSDITAVSATPFEISADGINYGYSATLTNATNVLSVRYIPTASTIDSAVISFTSGSVSTDVNVYGTGVDCNVTFPLHQDFETVEDVTMCWTVLSMNSVNGISLVSNMSTTGNVSFRFSSYSSASDYTQYLITPELPVTTDTKMVSFDYAGYTSGTETFVVGYSSTTNDPTDQAAFTWGTTNSVTGTTWHTFLKSDIPGDAKYIAIKYTSNYAYYLYVDNMLVDETPDCFTPNAVNVSGITFEQATINWTPMGNETSWEVVVVEHGNDVSTGTIEYVSAHPYTVTNLMPFTQYDVYVLAECTEGNSNWTPVTTFTTLPFCQIPTGINASNISYDQADINWTPAGDETSWNLVVVEHGGDVNNGTVIPVTQRPYTVTGLTTATQYDVYVAADCISETSPWSSVYTFTTTPDCSNPSNPQVSNVTGTSAVISWTAAPYGVTSYTVEYGEAESGSTEQVFVDSATTVTLTGLSPQTDYEFTITSDCNSATITPVPVAGTFSTGCLVGGDIIFDNGTETSYYIPVNNYYNYSYTQQIFLSSEMGGENNLSSVSFEYAGSSPSTAKTNCVIYLGHTNQSSFSSSSDYIPVTDLTQVYSGNLNCHQGWNTFTFDTTFHYDGISNLVLVVDDNSSDFDGSSYVFKNHTTSANRTLYFYEDSANPDPTNPTASGAYAYTGNIRNNVKFGGECDETSTCVAPVITNVNVASTEVTFTWSPGYQESAWNLQYKAADDTTWTDEGSVTSPYTVSNLNVSTTYTFHLYSDCGSEYSSPALAEATTLPCDDACIYVINMTDGFGDGWNGNAINILANGIPAATVTIDDGNNASYTYYQCGSAEVSFNWVLGSYPDETSFTIEDGNGNTIYTCANGSSLTDGAEFFNYTCGTILCARPQDVVVSNITTSSAEVAWTETGSATTWNIEYGPAGFTQGQGTIEVATSNPYTISSLTPSTLYDIYVQADCGGGDTSFWSNPGHFSTECVAITVPYTENFNNYTTTATSTLAPTGYPNDNMPLCWTFLNRVTNTSIYPQVFLSSYSSYAVSGNCLFFKSSSSTPLYAVLPEFTDNISDLALSFSYRNESVSTSNGTLYVGYMTDPTDATTFTSVQTCNQTTTITLIEDVVFTNAPVGSYIAFKYQGGDYNNYYLSIDNVNVDIIPTCPKPHNLTISNVTNSSVELTWTEVGTATAWTVAYGPEGFNPDTAVNIEYASDTTIVINNLTAGTAYDFYVQSDCGGETSEWVGPVTAIPGTFNMPVTGNATITMCGGTIYDNGGANGNYADNCDARLTVNPETSADLVSISGTLTAESATWDYLIIYDGDGVTELYHSNQSSGATVTFGPIVSTTGPLTIYFHSDGSTNYSGFALNVTCTPAPTCRKPMNFTVVGTTTTDAILSWTEMGTATTWNIEYGPTGFTPGQGTTEIATTNPYTVTGLTTATAYDFYIQADCGGGDVSEWSSVASATTDCDVIATFPFTENFDASTNLPDCWNNANVTGDTEWEVSTPDEGSVYSAHSGSNAAVFFQDDEGDQADLQMPTFDLTSLTNPVLTFWYTNESWSGDIDELTVYYRNSVTDAWSQLTSHTSGASTWTFDSLALPNPSATYQIKFHATSNYGYGIHIDDVIIMDANGSDPGTTCDAPTNVAASNIAQTSATITWTPGGDETSWNLQYKAAADANWSNSIAVSNTPSYALTGLTANTAYQVRVQAVCDANNVSDWANGTFTTLNQDEPTCPAPTNVAANDITKNSAVITWSQEPNTASSWTVLYKQSAASSWETATANAMTYTLSGLNAETQYDVQVMANCDNGMQSSASETIHFTTLIDGVNDYVLEAAISVYPNPTNGQFTIDNEQCTINSVEVYDVYGKLIGTTKVDDTHVTLDINTYADGVYFARILTDKGVVTKRIVKK